MADKDFIIIIMVPETPLGNSKTRPPSRPTTTEEGGKEGPEKSRIEEGEKEKERDKEKEGATERRNGYNSYKHRRI